MKVGDKVQLLKPLTGRVGSLPVGTIGVILLLNSAPGRHLVTWDGYSGGPFDMQVGDIALVSEWKVGDQLSWNANPDYTFAHLTTRQLGEIYEITRIRSDGTYILSDGTAWDPNYWKPITKYWTQVPSGLPPYQIGDRVERTSADNNGVIPTGTLGTVTDVATDQLIVLWDPPHDYKGNYPYAWPARAALISKLGTGQTKKRALRCSRCNEGAHEYAEPNQPDGTFKCWLCGKYPYR